MHFIKAKFPLALAVCLNILFLTSAEAIEKKPLVAQLNETIHAQDSAVTVEKIVIYPNEQSLYETGQVNHGMPVKQEFGKGPIVVLHINKYPDYPREALFGLDWIQVDLFSDEKKLGQGIRGDFGSAGRVFGFNFWVKADMSVSPDGAVELEELGQLELKVTLFKVVKIIDFALHDLPRGETPVYEDGNVRIWEALWGKKWDKYQEKNITTFNIDLQNKTESASYHLTFRSKGSNQYIGPGRMDHQFYANETKNELAGAQLWKVVPALRKTIAPLKFKPQ